MDDKFHGWIGKKVFLELKSGRRYSGIIKETTPHFIFIIDKYAEKVVISITDISILQEEQ